MGREDATFSSIPFGNARTHIRRAVSPQDGVCEEGHKQQQTCRVAELNNARTNKQGGEKTGQSATQRRLAAARGVAGAEPRAASPRQREGRTWSCGPPGRGDAGAQQAVGSHSAPRTRSRRQRHGPPARGRLAHVGRTNKTTNQRRPKKTRGSTTNRRRGVCAHVWAPRK